MRQAIARTQDNAAIWDYTAETWGIDRADRYVDDIRDTQFPSVEQVKPQLQDALQRERITKLIKDSGLKVQASIQGDTVRVNGAKRDLLQDTIALDRKSVV